LNPYWDDNTALDRLGWALEYPSSIWENKKY